MHRIGIADEAHGPGFDADRSTGTRCDTRTDTTVAFYTTANPNGPGQTLRAPSLNWQSVRAIHRVQDFDGHVEGHIYAQPLYWRAPGAGPLVIVATER